MCSKRSAVSLACAIALSAAGAVSQAHGDNLDCNRILLNAAELGLLERAAASLSGQDSGIARERFKDFGDLHFEFLEHERGRSGRLYHLFSAEDDEKNVIVVFESENGAIRHYHIRSYTKSHPDSGAFQEVPVSCFPDQRSYFEYIQTRIPATTSKMEDILSFSEASGLFFHRETIAGNNREMIFLQRPFPSDSIEADTGINFSPDLPIGICVVFDASTRQALDYKWPGQCFVDMALLARQFDRATGGGN
jgi:hypothetical protein